MRVPRKVFVVCQNPLCQKTFAVWPSKIKDGKAKFCSQTCFHGTPEDRFWSHVFKTETCWLWTASVFPDGYGVFLDKQGKKSTRAHIFSWKLHYGPVPDGMLVCHNCPGGDNPACVNPAHLWLGTNAENMADMISKGRQARGSRIGVSKLTEPEVYAIRSLEGQQTATATGRQFHVSYVTILGIWSRKYWKHLPEL